MSQFTHLHLHTEYSLLDGANKLKELAKTLKAQGATSVAMTDHGNMFGAIDFYKTMKAEGIKPIIGLEAYLHNHDDLSDKSSRQRFHLCLFAKNEIGYKNLMFLSSQSYIHGLYYYPRINKKLLEKHSEGLICSSACLQGEVNWHLNTKNERNIKFGAKGYEGAKEAALWYKKVFGDDFYLEIMRHGIEDQKFIDESIIKLSKELDIKIIATNDTHYTFKERAAAHEVFMCIAMGVKLDDPGRLRHEVHEFYVKTPQQMSELFADIPEAIENTQEIANKCNLELKLGDPTPPNFKFTREYASKYNLNLIEDKEFSFDNDDIVFEHLCKKGLEERLQFIDESKHEEYKARLDLEINIIKNMKFSGYMLIVHDFIAAAKEKDIPVGPGRGSAAGSLVSYCLKITDLDPIPYNLLFERFLNPERVSMPDIDVDFCQDRRGEVIDYVIDKYGAEKVAQVITFGKLLAKGVIRDVARVCDMSIPDADALAKLVPEELKITLEKAYEQEPKIAEFINSHPKGHQVWDFAKALEGLNRNAGMHAAGVVISNEALWNKAPLFRQSKNDERHLVTQYSKEYLEDVDLIKFDFLGLKTLTVINNAIKLIKKRYNKDVIWEKIDVNDPKVYKTIQSGNTLGIFQIESGGMQSLNARLKPERFEDLIAVLALYRPGPLDSGMVDDFIEIKHGRKAASYAFEELKPILENTYGVIVYQEQVMQIVQKIGGFSLGGADNVRRAMGKKKREILDNLKAEYLEGAKKQGYDEKKADDLFELILKFAEYGFNKSHSAAYALITFQTAFLKTYYPSEFMAALLTSEESNVDKIAKYIEEMKRMNIKLLPPNINKAQREFSAIKLEDGSEAIIYGLGAIKSVGIPAIENIMDIRKDGGFSDFNDFISLIDPSKINKKTIENLAKSGAFDDFGYTRKCLIDNLELISETSKKIAEVKRNSTASLFGEDEIAGDIKVEIRENKNEFDLMEKLGYEKEMLGIYVSGHPLDKFSSQMEGIEYYKSIDFEELKGEGEILTIGKIEDFKSMMSKNGKRYAKAEILDLYSSFEMIIFEAQVEKVENIFKEKKEQAFAFLLRYKNNDNDLSFSLNEIYTLEEAKENEIKSFNKKKNFQKKEVKEEYTQEPAKFEENIIELDINKLSKDMVYEIYSLANSKHNPKDTNNKKLVLKVLDVGSCLLYHTGFVISKEVFEEISQKCKT
ncbi:DNA polymerase III subunit alpha [Campylobacter volucris]|uniref:DNA polymerase III subunit alpha n=1 Tax=Campylobacter volucris TaxID=1031542 RepID=A0A5C7DTC3_9BACT|nr:DNA polymerase III subunit alpha [Campylobacter volucris]TXE89474.1 DNA polymerase III subunit alpha [Campylobacter volucris]